MLYIVATPIGNLEDLTLRALRVLKEVDYILCEDTRVTMKLLARYEISGKKLISYHQHSSDKKIQEISELIKNNQVALVTDAGTPGISDPGNKLIAALVETQQCCVSTDVVPIPGPSAVIAALSVSGLPTDKFIFKGFVPHKKGRETFLRAVLAAEETVVFYESCHRIIKTLEFLSEHYLSLCHPRESGDPVDIIISSHSANVEIPAGVYPVLRYGAGMTEKKELMTKEEKHFVVCRELTKKFETIYRGTAEEILAQIKKDFPMGNPKGEFVVAH